MDDMELIDEIVKRAEEHQKQKEKEFAISELEKVRKKIKNDSIIYEERFVDMDALQGCLCGIDAIIDNEIFKLKEGESDVN